MSTININSLKDNLKNSIYNKDLYSEYFNENENTFNSPLIIEIENIYNKIITEIQQISHDQMFVINRLFNQFKTVQEKIDPNRLRDFSYSKNEDGDILLYRNSDTHLINLVIHPEEDFSLSIINKKAGNSLNYYNNNIEESEYEKVVYNFLV